MTEQTQAAPAAAETAAITADDLSLIDPRLADTVKDEAELWNEIQAEENARDNPAAKTVEDDPEPEAEAAPAAAVDENTPKPDAPAAEAPKPDIWANATPEQRAAYEQAVTERAKFEQRSRSASGRISALQRKINAAQDKPSRDIGNARDEIAGIQEDYPDIAQPLSKALEKLDGKVDRLSASEKADLESAQSELNDLVDAETNRLLAVHPDYVDVLNKNGRAFVAWVEDQPRAIREAAHQNANVIADSDAAIKVVEGFKKHLGLVKDTPAPTPDPAPQPAPQPKLDDRRQRQIQGSASPQGKVGRPTVSGIPEEGDAKAIWDAFDAQERLTR
ncbi:hypothetical protein ACFFTN_01425 [Aminobacter aganoensis]|uniref:Uncharacterized protein n=1 Tax=Aminobacter aganoensis TaxID=83264 RepID=A0A7X0F5K8_9HYPH|nr:hypothetical protein [Aminobacter aganoensis]MBB6353480.1 hypothetical protein [Aminobacter aganoensis]